MLEIVYSNHAEKRVLERNISKKYLNILIDALPPFKGVIRFRFQNSYYAVLSNQNGIILVVTCGKNEPKGRKRRGR